MNKLTLFIIICCSFLTQGCSSHHLMVVNETGHYLTNLTVKYPKMDWKFTFGNKAIRAHSGHGNINKSIPEEIVVSWNDEFDLKKYHKNVEIKQKLPSMFKLMHENQIILILTTDKEALFAYYESGQNTKKMIILPDETESSFKKRKLNFQLINAVMNNRFSEVKTLVQSGADINSRIIDSDLTPIYAALGNADIMKYLLNKGAKSGHEIVAACRDNQINSLKLLIEYGGDVNYEMPWRYTPLVAAASNGHLEIVKILVENGADINKKIYNNLTARHSARNIEIVNFLDSKGANETLQLETTDEYYDFTRKYVEPLPIKIKTKK